MSARQNGGRGVRVNCFLGFRYPLKKQERLEAYFIHGSFIFNGIRECFAFLLDFCATFYHEKVAQASTQTRSNVHRTFAVVRFVSRQNEHKNLQKHKTLYFQEITKTLLYNFCASAKKEWNVPSLGLDSVSNFEG